MRCSCLNRARAENGLAGCSNTAISRSHENVTLRRLVCPTDTAKRAQRHQGASELI
jgi:hypothetical protein